MGQEHDHKNCFMSTKPIIHPSIHPSWFTPVHNNSTNFDFRCNVTARDFKAANSYHSICWKAMNLLVMRASAVNPFHTTKDVHGNYIVLWLGFATLSYKLWYVTYVQAMSASFVMLFQMDMVEHFLCILSFMFSLVLANWMTFVSSHGGCVQLQKLSWNNLDLDELFINT
jgi:hypothetical protein